MQKQKTHKKNEIKQVDVQKIQKNSETAKRNLDWLILNEFYLNETTGYKLRKELKKDFGVTVSFGTLFPHLGNLKRQGFIVGEENKRAPMKLTQKGLSHKERLGREIRSLREATEKMTHQ